MNKIATASYEFQYIYKTAIAFSLTTPAINSLYHLKEEKYFSKLLDLLLWNKKNLELLSLLEKNKYKKFSTKTYIKMLNSAIYLKNKPLIRIFLTKIDPKKYPKLVSNAYLALGDIKKGYQILKTYKPNDIKTLASYALWAGDYKNALKYFKQINSKDEKTLYN